MNFAIIIPSYNPPNTFSSLLKSIRKITSMPIIIIDDGSEKLITDEKIVREKIFPIKLKYIQIDNSNKLIIGVKRNFLVSHASNQICINMDDDDIYLNNYIL